MASVAEFFAGDGKIIVCENEAGIQAQGGFKLRDRLLRPSLLRENIAEIIVRECVIRTQPRRIGKRLRGLLGFSLPGAEDAELEQGRAWLGRDFKASSYCPAASSSLPVLPKAWPRPQRASANRERFSISLDIG